VVLADGLLGELDADDVPAGRRLRCGDALFGRLQGSSGRKGWTPFWSASVATAQSWSTATAHYTDVPQQSLLSTLWVPVMHFWRVTSQPMPARHPIGLSRRCGGARQQSNTKGRCCLGWITVFQYTSLRRTPISR
jgi:hypothetical protein